MGVGISAHRLAGTVAALGAVGTIASVDLRRHHPDLMAASRARADKADRRRGEPDRARPRDRAAQRRSPRGRGHGRGQRDARGLRIRRATCARPARAAPTRSSSAPGCRSTCPSSRPTPRRRADPDPVRRARHRARREEVGAQGPPARTRSSIEHPRYAGGHLGAAKIEDLADPRFDFERVLPETLAFFRAEGIADGAIPLIPAGGINTHERVRELIALGAVGRAARHRVRGHRGGRRRPRVQARARRRDAGGHRRVHERRRPAGARRAHALAREVPRAPAEARRGRAQEAALHAQVRLPDPVRPARRHRRRSASSASTRSSPRRCAATSRKGLFFRGAAALPFGTEIRPVRDLIAYLLTGRRPASMVPAAG